MVIGIMAAQAIQPFYELKMWVAEESGLRKTYTDAVMKHNKVSISSYVPKQKLWISSSYNKQSRILKLQ